MLTFLKSKGKIDENYSLVVLTLAAQPLKTANIAAVHQYKPISIAIKRPFACHFAKYMGL